MAGAISILLVLHGFEKVHQINFPSITIWIDNSKVLRQILGKVTHHGKDYLSLDYDLWCSLLEVNSWIQTEIKWGKVDSHITDKVYEHSKEPKGNPIAWQLNETADLWAGMERELMMAPPPEIFSQQGLSW